MSFTFIWSVENNFHFSSFEPSPDFVVHALENRVWDLKLECENEDLLSLYLRRCDNYPKEILVDYELSILAEDGSILFSQKENRRSFKMNDLHGFSKFATYEELFQTKKAPFAPPRNLKIRCQMWKSDGELTETVQCFGQTTREREFSTFVWKLDGFSRMEVNEERSFLVMFGSLVGPVLRIHLCITRDSNNSEEELTAEIYKIKYDNGKDRDGVCFLSLLEATGNVADTITFKLLSDKVVVKLPILFSRKKLMSSKELYLPNDILSTAWQIVFPYNRGNYHIYSTNFSPDAKFLKAEYSNGKNCISSKIEKETAVLMNELRSLYEDQILCDVKLKTTNETFPAHKNILSARSRVFRAMFQSDFKEKSEDCVEIPDVDADTMRRMLLYVYTSSFEDMQWSDASLLYEASDKYEIISLKNKCSAFLRAKLSPHNACEILLVADIHQDKELKAFVQEYILRQSKEILGSDAWKALMRNHSRLAAETMYERFLKNGSF